MNIPFAFFMMILIVASSNYLVMFPLNDWLTWGAFAYPASFLITELTNRFHGAQTARRVVYAGFIVGVIVSIQLSTPRIAWASGTAFLVAQLLDISIFNRLRQQAWWYAPLCSSVVASFVDTMLFMTLAFYGEDVPFITLGLGDFAVKVIVDLAMLTPFRFAVQRSRLAAA